MLILPWLKDREEGFVFQSPIADRSASERARLVESFQSAPLVRHVAIDGFLEPDAAVALSESFPTTQSMPKSRDYVFSNKHELSTLDRHSDLSRQVHDALFDEAFTSFLSSLVDRPVFLDPEYVGGGFHVGGAGSFLDLHTDFNLHPVHTEWLRELNILIYLNPRWEDTWGGELKLTDDPARTGTKVQPRFNRAVIMESTDRSYHGYDKLRFPEGEVRQSVAAYAYSHVTDASVRRRTTNWVPNDAGTAKRVLARNWNRLVLTKNKFFGSGTLKNRR